MFLAMFEKYGKIQSFDFTINNSVEIRFATVNAYIAFSTKQEARSSLAMNGTKIMKKRIRVKWCNDGGRRARKPPRRNKNRIDLTKYEDGEVRTSKDKYIKRQQ